MFRMYNLYMFSYHNVNYRQQHNKKPFLRAFIASYLLIFIIQLSPI
ncbi:hypothetical protein EMIT0180MI3_110058 [Priestia megaterium]